jgi:hypothetical protein
MTKFMDPVLIDLLSEFAAPSPVDKILKGLGKSGFRFG